ncbi:GbsR/MarR family transcriptional regulator [Sediminicola arcticus]|jgi:DNA-binding transcriptional regulator GbsR (MarR family)|uniref:Transcriptional regulator n=1 Tax=Sediminicola arcticus TaxID=1574308 RepID=A0ABV2SUL1_9FLAO
MGICSEEKRTLIEEVGLHLESSHKLTPLASRIYAIMILSSEEGFSFEEIMSITQASKSSVSTNISLLVQLNYVEFYTKSGDRKRYFRGTNNYLKLTLQEYLLAIEKELKLVKKINQFNKEHTPTKFVENESMGVFFQDYLTTQKKNIKKTLEKLKAFQNQDKGL